MTELIFADGSSIEIQAVLKGEEFFQGNIRKTITVLINEPKLFLEDYIRMFKNPEKTKALFTLDKIETSIVNTEGETIITNEDIKEDMGMDFSLYKMASHETDTVTNSEGKVTTDLVKITIAQKTYQEKLMEQILGEGVK